MITFTVTSRELFNKCTNLARVINGKQALPVLDNFMFELKGYELRITASDSEHFAVAHIALQDEYAHCTFALNAKTMVTALKELPEQPLTIKVDETSCIIKYNNGHFNMPVVKVDEYPVFPALNDTAELTLSAETLKRVFSRTPSFVSNDELRPVMCGVCFDFDEKLEVVASNGHVLIKLTEDCTHEGKGRFIMSLKTMKLSECFMGKEEESVTISHNSSHSYIKFADYELYSRLIEGKYPNYNAVIPDNYTDSITFDRVEMLNSVKRVSVFSNAASQLLKFTVSGFELNIKGQDIDFSTSAEETLMIEKEGKDMFIGFKATLTQQILSVFADTKIRMKYMDQSRAAIFVSEGTDSESSSMLVLQMPMLVNF